MIDDVPVVVLLDEHRVAVERVLHARARHARAEVREHEDLQQRVHPLHRREQERLRLRAPHRFRFVPELCILKNHSTNIITRRELLVREGTKI